MGAYRASVLLILPRPRRAGGLPLGEGGSGVSRKLETDEGGNLPEPSLSWLRKAPLHRFAVPLP